MKPIFHRLGSPARSAAVILALATFAVASLVYGLCAGSVFVDPAQLLHALTTPEDPLHGLIGQLRLPRVLAAFAVGGLLGLSGALLQALLRNPLADPYVLGVSGGAAVGTLGAMLLGLGALAGQVAGFAGALLSMVFVFVLARRGGQWSSTRLLLTGVVLASGWAALISFILAISPEQQLRGMMFWLMGDMSHSPNATAALVALAAGVLLYLPLARGLALLGRGELHARALGVEIDRLQPAVYVLASLLTAMAVNVAGNIGFIGLIVPHLCRLLLGHEARLTPPAAVLLGGGLLVCADTLARTVIAPQQLPVGIITALLGVPVFLYLLQRRGG